MTNNLKSSVSLIIPAYNRGTLLAETVDAALAQTIPFSEIIVVNDGSTDNTLDILNLYSNKVRIINITNQGVQVARNIGANAATTNWVAFCDSDDILLPNFLQTILECGILEKNIDIIFSNFITFDTNKVYDDKFSLAPKNYFCGSTISKHVAYAIPNIYLRSIQFQAFFQSGMIIKKSFFESLDGYNPIFKGVGAEDWEFTLRAISLGNTGVYLLPLVKVRKHIGNDSADALKMSLGEVLILEYAINNHSAAKKYLTEIINSIDRRRADAFSTAFSRGHLRQAVGIAEALKSPPLTLSFKIKMTISSLPPALGRALWWLSQKFSFRPTHVGR